MMLSSHHILLGRQVFSSSVPTTICITFLDVVSPSSLDVPIPIYYVVSGERCQWVGQVGVGPMLWRALDCVADLRRGRFIVATCNRLPSLFQTARHVSP